MAFRNLLNTNEKINIQFCPNPYPNINYTGGGGSDNIPTQYEILDSPGIISNDIATTIITSPGEYTIMDPSSVGFFKNIIVDCSENGIRSLFQSGFVIQQLAGTVFGVVEIPAYNKILIYGTFTSVLSLSAVLGTSGTLYSRAILIDMSDNSFSPLANSFSASGSDNGIFTHAYKPSVNPDIIILGGNFTTNTVVTSNIVIYNFSTNTFDITTLTANGTVNQLSVSQDPSDNTIVACGTFTTFGLSSSPTASNGLIRWDFVTNSGFANLATVITGGAVSTCQVAFDPVTLTRRIWIGGTFTAINSLPVTAYCGYIDLDVSNNLSYGGIAGGIPFSSAVLTLHYNYPYNNNLFIGGGFINPHQRICFINDGRNDNVTQDVSPQVIPNGTVNYIYHSYIANELTICGRFQSIGRDNDPTTYGENVSFIVSWNYDTSANYKIHPIQSNDPSVSLNSISLNTNTIRVFDIVSKGEQMKQGSYTTYAATLIFTNQLYFKQSNFVTIKFISQAKSLNDRINYMQTPLCRGNNMILVGNTSYSWTLSDFHSYVNWYLQGMRYFTLEK